MRSRLPTAQIRANEEGASAATNRALGNDRPGDESRRPGQCADCDSRPRRRRRSRRQNTDWLSAQQPQTPMRQPEIDNGFHHAARYNEPRAGAFEVTSMIRRTSRTSAICLSIARQEDSPSGGARLKAWLCKLLGSNPHPPPFLFHGHIRFMVMTL